MFILSKPAKHSVVMHFIYFATIVDRAMQYLLIENKSMINHFKMCLGTLALS